MWDAQMSKTLFLNQISIGFNCMGCKCESSVRIFQSNRH